ncbi:DEKNAAC101918 [Brettanomyces naardenensis]|uniref:Nucleolar protein 9 n=1 Tax=Brettanomyces naardenensis TaxID=13370 RepID=A0A448YJB0_BRENA|nr:DEKNAAC101918 [Brettanomyces naardenensis]
MGKKVRGRKAKKERHSRDEKVVKQVEEHDRQYDQTDKVDTDKEDVSMAPTTVNPDAVSFADTDSKSEQMPFFGLLDSEQSAYFRQAESSLNLDTFDSPEAKLAFVEGVLEESKGNELKLATNQICSKLMERLILVSNEHQMRQIYNGCKGFFYQLCIHKYASHVMETFLVRTAAMVEKEMLRKKDEDYAEYEAEEGESGDAGTTIEGIILEVAKEVEPKLKKLAKSQYGSHVLRVLLLILGGKKLPSSIESNSILRSKKSKIARKMVEIEDNEDYERSFQIPSTFQDVLGPMLNGMMEGETTESLRETAINAVASPVLQLLIQLEGMVNRDRPFWTMTFARADEEKNDKEEAFVEYLLSDPVGSHFLQTALSQQKMKNINRLYKNYMETRISKLAKRETTGSFVIQTLLEKLKPKDQQTILDELVPILNELIVNNFGLGSSIVDCSERNGGYLKDEIVAKLFEFFNRTANGKKMDDTAILENILQLSGSTLFSTKDDWPTSEERRRAMFLEKLIEYDGRFLNSCIEALLGLAEVEKPKKRERRRVGRERTGESEPEKEEGKEDGESIETTTATHPELPSNMLIEICMHGVFSHIVESCITSPEKLDLVLRKRFLNEIVPHVIELACNAQGSHIVDRLFSLTFKLNVYKERIARKLLDNEELVKRTVYGRQVWKNWKMDMYARHFGDWKRMIKQEEIDRAAEEKELRDAERESHMKRARGAHDDNGRLQKRRKPNQKAY